MPPTTFLDKTIEHQGDPVPPPHPSMPVVAYRGAEDTESHAFTIPAGQVFESCSLEVQDGRYDYEAFMTSNPRQGDTGAAKIDVHWKFNGGPNQSFIRYRVRAVSVPQTELVPEHKVPGFLPSSSGLHFDNQFANVTVTIQVGPVAVPLRGANGGACGGMAFLVRDLFEAGYLVPPDEAAPGSGPLYDAIMSRLQDSFNLPDGPARYLELMDPNLRDAPWPPLPLPAKRGRGAILREAWDRIREDIDAGRLAPLGLVLVRSADPVQIANNHQVLAHGYTARSDREGVMFLYDPNYHEDDHVTIAFRVENDDRVSLLRSPYPTLVGFFRNDYTPVSPARPGRGDSVRAAFRASNGLWVVAEDGGGGVVNANRPVAREWETFTIERTGTGVLRSGELVNLRAMNGDYVVAENRGGGAVNANRQTPLGWERFVIDLVGGDLEDEIHDGNEVTLRTDGDRYLVPSGDVLVATGTAPHAAARFVLTYVP